MFDRTEERKDSFGIEFQIYVDKVRGHSTATANNIFHGLACANIPYKFKYSALKFYSGKLF